MTHTPEYLRMIAARNATETRLRELNGACARQPTQPSNPRPPIAATAPGASATKQRGKPLSQSCATAAATKSAHSQ